MEMSKGDRLDKRMFLIATTLIALIALSLLTTTPLVAQERKNYFVGAWPYLVPPTGHFNPFATNAITLGIYFDLIWAPLGMYIWHNGSWFKILGEKWGFSPDYKTYTVNIRKDAKWSDGTPFTSKDIKCTWLLLWSQGHALFKYVSPNIETPDDYTAIFTIVNPVSPMIIERYIIRQNYAPYKTYKQFCDQLEALVKAGVIDFKVREVQNVAGNLSEFRPERMLASGPFEIDVASITEAELWLKKNPYSPLAANVLFDWIRLYNGETPTVMPLVMAKEIDYATHGFPVAAERQFIELGIKILRPPTYFGPSLAFNYNHSKYGELFKKKEFRQAIAYAINMTENAFVSLGVSARPSKYMTGVFDEIAELWLLPEYKGMLNTYSYSPAKAEELLKGIGLEKRGGVWYWKGEPVELEIIVHAEFADWSASAENVKTQLERFGFKVVLRPTTFTQVDPLVQQGQFMISFVGWGTGHPHPFMSYDSLFATYNTREYRGTGYTGMALPMIWGTKMGNVNATELIYLMGYSLDMSKQKEAFSKMAVAYNDFLPVIPLWQRYGNNPVLDGVRVCGWLPFDNPIYYNSVYTDSFIIIMIYAGTLHACGIVHTPRPTPTPTPTPTPATPAATITVEKTVTVTVTTLATTTRVETVTDWTITAVLAIVLLIVGIAIGWFIKRR